MTYFETMALRIAEEVDRECGQINGPGSEWLAKYTRRLMAEQPSTNLPEGCMWAVTKGGRTICQPPRRAPTPTQDAVDAKRHRFAMKHVNYYSKRGEYIVACFRERQLESSASLDYEKDIDAAMNKELPK